MTDVAVLVPVGPSEKELQRLDDLLDSIRACEPEVRSLVLIDGQVDGEASSITHQRLKSVSNIVVTNASGNENSAPEAKIAELTKWGMPRYLRDTAFDRH